ncbi:hypothetical protein K7432_006780 [Basidiobolus ranarum]|uniref:Uncharacterized protein n=1 Tax=Basidiobolus ranarum TaxID=34480 RepID=A0ABR2WUG3_9FUNG
MMVRLSLHQAVIVYLLLCFEICSALPVPPKLYTLDHVSTARLEKRLGIGIRLKASHRERSKKTGKDVGFQAGIGFEAGIDVGKKDQGQGVKVVGHTGLSAIGRVFTDDGSGEGEIGLKAKTTVELGTDSTGKKAELNAGVNVNANIGGSIDTEPKSMPWDISMHDIDPEEFKRLLKNSQAEKF